MPSVSSVFPVSGKLGLAPTSHTLDNSGDLVSRDQPRFLLHYRIESLSVSWCQYNALDPLSKTCNTFSTVDMSEERTDHSMLTVLY